MKNILALLLLIASILVGCSSSHLSFSEIEVVPDEIEYKIDSNYTLQLINDGDDTSYIVYQSRGTVVADIKVQEETIKVKLDDKDKQDGVIKQYVYQLTLDPENEVIEVLINGKLTPIDNVTSL